MKKKFEGRIYNDIPADWDSLSGGGLLSAAALKALKRSGSTPFRCIVHPEYACTEYRMKLNLFTFGKLKLRLSFVVIAPPVSIDACGCSGDLAALVGDYKRRKGLFLMLNLKETPCGLKKTAKAQTLASCIFTNCYASFDEYISALRSGYRRRLVQAIAKGKTLTVRKINNQDFDNTLHRLYLEVLQRSNYPLETLGVSFFQELDGEIYVFYEQGEPLAFAAVSQSGDRLDFVFGGMDYANRDRLDLYYNMLLHILRIGIERNVRSINFGQTAEGTKLRIGCKLNRRYMLAFSGNPFFNRLLICAQSFLGYSEPKEACRCFK